MDLWSCWHVGRVYVSCRYCGGGGEIAVFMVGGRRAVTKLHTFLYNVTFCLLMALVAGEKHCEYYVL